jgi:hypothetical protein
MAKNSLQEKFQTSYPYKEEDNEGKTWQWAKDGALKPRPISGGYVSNSYAHPWQAKVKKDPIPHVSSQTAMNGVQIVTDLEEWVIKENGGMPLSTASATDVTNVVSKHDLKSGFCLHDMDSVDDEYTGANQDHFYGVVEGPDDAGNKVTGFAERNNYLDRL